MSVIHAALMGSYRTSNAGVIVSNCAAHVSWTEHVACQWNGQAHVLSVMKARVAQRRHGRVPPVGLCRAQYATWKHRGSA
jgi:NAD dependent epimerase/dehydratase family enzyme